MGSRAFAKGHGTGNDFVLLPDVGDDDPLTPELARALCDRRTGVGADGVLRVVRDAEPGAWFMDHYNADGTTPEMCGNGIRVFGRFLVSRGLAPAGHVRVRTHGGWRSIEVPEDGDVSVDMGSPVVDASPRRVTATGSTAGTARTADALAVDMGNPHAVAVSPMPLEELDLTVPPVAEPPFPHGVNVELVELLDERALRLRVHERGVGETRSCGTGACAAAVAAATWAGVDGEWEWSVGVPGGLLRVRWDGATIHLVGPAVLVADGVVDLDAL